MIDDTLIESYLRDLLYEEDRLRTRLRESHDHFRDRMSALRERISPFEKPTGLCGGCRTNQVIYGDYVCFACRRRIEEEH